MILYEYKCKECGNIFELFIPENDDKYHPICPLCLSENVNKVITTPGIIWKTDGNVGKISK